MSERERKAIDLFARVLTTAGEMPSTEEWRSFLPSHVGQLSGIDESIQQVEPHSKKNPELAAHDRTS